MSFDFEKFANSPYTHMGMGLLGQAGAPNGWAGVGRGMQQGLMSYQDMLKQQQMQKYRQMQMGQMQNQMGQQAATQQWAQQNYPGLPTDLAKAQFEAGLQQPKDPTSYREWALAGKPGTYEDYLNSKHQPLVQMSPGETKFNQKMGELNAGYYDQYAQSAKKSRSDLNRYKQIAALVGDAETGQFGDVLLAAQKAAKMMGFDIGENIPGREAAQIVSRRFALELRNTAEGAGMPGQMSDKDREFLNSMAGGLGTTKEGRLLLIEAASRVAKRKSEIASMAREYMRNHKTFDDADFSRMVEERYKDKPMWNDLLKAAGKIKSKPAAGLSIDDQQELEALRKDQGGM